MSQIYHVNVSSTESWSRYVRADSEEEAERIATAEFRRYGGCGPYITIDELEEIDEDSLPDGTVVVD